MIRLPTIKSWLRLVICYWLLTSIVFFIDFKYMSTGWAGLPGFIVTLPLSVVVATIGLAAEPVAARFGYSILVNGYHFEYGFIVCAFLNAFIFYLVYFFWANRRRVKKFEAPPPPPNELLT